MKSKNSSSTQRTMILGAVGFFIATLGYTGLQPAAAQTTTDQISPTDATTLFDDIQTSAGDVVLGDVLNVIVPEEAAMQNETEALAKTLQAELKAMLDVGYLQDDANTATQETPLFDTSRPRISQTTLFWDGIKSFFSAIVNTIRSWFVPTTKASNSCGDIIQQSCTQAENLKKQIDDTLAKRKKQLQKLDEAFKNWKEAQKAAVDKFYEEHPEYFKPGSEEWKKSCTANSSGGTYINGRRVYPKQCGPAPLPVVNAESFLKKAGFITSVIPKGLLQRPPLTGSGWVLMVSNQLETVTQERWYIYKMYELACQNQVYIGNIYFKNGKAYARHWVNSNCYIPFPAANDYLRKLANWRVQAKRYLRINSTVRRPKVNANVEVPAVQDKSGVTQ